MIIGQKWNYEKHAYDRYILPDGASMYETNMNNVVQCAGCGKYIFFGQCYTSQEIHTESGMGYAVCPECHEAEMKRRFKNG